MWYLREVWLKLYLELSLVPKQSPLLLLRGEHCFWYHRQSELVRWPHHLWLTGHCALFLQQKLRVRPSAFYPPYPCCWRRRYHRCFWNWPTNTWTQCCRWAGTAAEGQDTTSLRHHPVPKRPGDGRVPGQIQIDRPSDSTMTSQKTLEPELEALGTMDRPNR